MKHTLIFLLCLFILNTACTQTGDSKKPINETELSIAELSKKIEAEPKNTDLLLQRAGLYENKNDFNAAILDVQKAIEIQPTNIPFYLKISDLFLKAGQIKNTAGALNKALSIDPKHIEANLKMAELYLMYKKYPEVFKHLNLVLDIDPYNTKAFFMRGYSYKEMADTNSAVKNFIEAVKNDPKNSAANLELGIIFSAKNNPLAVEYYKNALAYDSNNVSIYYNLGLYYQTHELLNEALASYQQIIKMDPKFPYSYYNIGYIYLQLLNIPEEAVPYFTKAIEANPAYYEAYFNRGYSYEKLGNVYKAKEDYDNALKIKVNYPKAIEGLNRIDNIVKQSSN